MKPQKFSISDILTRSPLGPKPQETTKSAPVIEDEPHYVSSLPTPPRSPEPEVTMSSDAPIKETPKRESSTGKRKRDPIGQILDSLCSDAEKKSTQGPSAFSPIITSSCTSQLSPISLLSQCDRRCLQTSPNMACSPYAQTTVATGNDALPNIPTLDQINFLRAAHQQQQHHYQFQQQQQLLHQQQSIASGRYPFMLNNAAPQSVQHIQMLRQQQAQLMAIENYNANALNRPCGLNSIPANSPSPYWMSWLKSSAEAVSSLPAKESRIPPPPRYQCDDCKKSYSTFGGLSKHKQFHCVSHVKKEFNCKFCDKSYGSLGALKMHIRTHTLPCKCKLCGKAFSRPWLLQGHVRTHTGEKPFTCVTCHRAFADRSNLRAHLQTHSDIKKYGCKNCTKTFSRMSLLLKHEEGSCIGLRR